MTPALLLLFGVLLAGLLLRQPIGFAMLAAGTGYLLYTHQDLGLLSEQMGDGLYNSYVLLAVPLFLFAANIMNAGQISERLFDFCSVLVGRQRGGLAQVNILVTLIFSGMTGSAIADAAGPGLVTIRQMLKRPEYSPGFAGAVVIASATLGPMVPPSIPMVIYALVSGASVGALFLAGLLPGVLMALMMMLLVAVMARRRGLPQAAPVPRARWAGIALRGLLPLSMPVLLLGGIYSGIFTPTEAAAVAALHALLLAALVYRSLSWRAFWELVLASARGSAVITLILAGSLVLNYAFTAEGMPQAVAAWVDGMQLARWQFLLLVDALFLLLGCFLDVSVLLLVFVPMLLPAVKTLGVSTVHFGVLVVLNMMIGLIHPPFGMLLFVTRALTGIPIGAMMKEGWPFLLLLLALLLALTFFPALALWLPRLMGYAVG